jgi:hypothetical protein
MATLVQGASTTTTVASNQLAIDIGKEIQDLVPDVQPLAVFSRAVDKEPATNPEFKWMEDELKPRFDTTGGTAEEGTTEITVTNGGYYQQWDQIIITRTGEQMRVDSVLSSTKIKVTRGIGSTAAALLNGDEILIVGTAQPENDTSKPARTRVPTLTENYTQIFRTPAEISNTLRATGSAVGPKEWLRLTANAGKEHVLDIEYSLLFGRKSKTTPGPTADRTTGGALSFISSNQTDAGGSLSEAEFNAAMAQVMRYGSKKKLALGSATAVAALNKFPASKQIVTGNETSYGINVQNYTGPFGVLNLVYHPLLEGSKYGGYLLILDMDEIWYRYLASDEENRDTKLLPNIQPPDQDGRKDEYLTECGLRFGLQRTHGVITNITS